MLDFPPLRLSRIRDPHEFDRVPQRSQPEERRQPFRLCDASSANEAETHRSPSGATDVVTDPVNVPGIEHLGHRRVAVRVPLADATCRRQARRGGHTTATGRRSGPVAPVIFNGRRVQGTPWRQVRPISRPVA